MKQRRKNAAAVALGKLSARKRTPEQRAEYGRRGGEIGGAARAASLSPAQRSAIAKKAAAARWKKEAKPK